MNASRPRVLVVEDSAAMRGLVTATLENGGAYEVTQAQSGFDALRRLPRSSFDLIITDINMPDINGLELVRFVRQSEQHRQTPMLIISTDGRETDRDRGLKLGANAYLVKPFQPVELLDTVKRLLQRAGS
jgi:two-component system chemotaxis response regulator CheY